MSHVPAPIAPDSPICQNLRCLPEKFVVDFANGIDVVRDHVRVQRDRSSFFSRMYDGFTGQGGRRQAIVNASLADGLEGSLQWLGELSESLARSNLALTQVNDRVTSLTRNMTVLAHYSADTRQKLDEIAHRLDTRMQVMAREIARIDYIQKAQLNLDATFDKWASGRLSTLAPAARCYAALAELHWGALGDFCRSHSGACESRDFMNMAIDRATQQLGADVRMQETSVNMRAVWLATPHIRGDGGDTRQALAYLADNMTARSAPFSYSAVQITDEGMELPLQVPLIATPRRIAEAMVCEVFPEEARYAL